MKAEGFEVIVLPDESDPGRIDEDWLERARGVLRVKTRLMLALGNPQRVRSTSDLTDALVQTALRVSEGLAGLRIALESGATALAFIRAKGWSRFDAIPEGMQGVGSLRPVGVADAPLLWVKPGSYPWPAGVFA